MLKGDKVILRPMKRDYLEKYGEYLNDVELLLLSSDDAPMPMEQERLIKQFERHIEQPRSDMIWFGIEVQGGRFVGQCLLHHIDQLARTCELGITIGDRDYLNQKYGRDVVSLLTRYAFRLLNMRKVWLTTNGTNLRAQKSFAACGFVEEGRLRDHIWIGGRYDDLVYMSAYREDSVPQEPVEGTDAEGEVDDESPADEAAPEV
ncbi:MAG: GNAT family N-acetyltransferase [Dehalococcoidia bacterium]